jgi:type I restriction enzyme S subunit
LPALPEQSRIAAVLNTADEAIAKTEAVIAKLRQVRAGLLHDLLTRGLDPNGQLRDPIAHPEQFQASPLGRIPKEWEVATLVSRISLPQGQVDPKASPYCDWTLVAPDHIESETGRLLARQTARQQDAISGKYVFEPSDVVYSKIRPYLRKAVLADERGLCSADMYPLRPNAGVNSRFLLAAVLGEPFSRFASAVSMRSGFPKLNRDELAEFTMGWPRPDEQNRIAALLCASDEEQLAVERELSKLEQLKSGLMTDLLTGRVRVSELDPLRPTL